MQQLISVILPTYNRGHLIEKAVKSVINQTYKNWELLVIDDGSTDNTLSIVKSYAQTDSRIKYQLLAKNSGVSVARNIGINESAGEYITFLDSDDEYLPRKIELQIECFKTSKVPNLGAVSCGREDYRDGIKYSEWKPKFRGNIVNNLLRKDRVGAGTPLLMTKKEIHTRFNIYFDPELPAGVDWDVLIRICQHAGFDFVPQHLVRVHHHHGDRVYTNDTALIAIEKQYKKYKHLLDQNKKNNDQFLLKMAVQNYMYGHPENAIHILKNRIINKNLRTLLWQRYMKIFRRYGSFPSKVLYKALEFISFKSY